MRMYVAFYKLFTTRPHRTHAARAKTRRSFVCEPVCRLPVPKRLNQSRCRVGYKPELAVLATTYCVGAQFKQGKRNFPRHLPVAHRPVSETHAA